MGMMEEASVDDRGRILIPKEIRDMLGMDPGSGVRLEVEGGKLVVTPPVSPEKFIEEMEGFITKGKPEIDPLKLKELWGKSEGDE